MAKKQEIKQLQEHWYKILEKHGFIDIEKNNKLKVHSAIMIQNLQKTKRFHDRDAVSEFYSRLNDYLNHNKLNPLHRQILELYSEGLKYQDIADRVDRCQSRVRQIVASYRWKVSTFILL